MKGEKEVRAKLKEAYAEFDKANAEYYQAQADYADAVVGALSWVLDEGDDPFED